MLQIKNIILKFLKCLSPEIRIKILFIYHLRYMPNLKNPRTFNEKICFRKLNENSKLMSICSDKFAVRDYVKNKIGEKYLIPLLYANSEIDIEYIKSLGGSVVIKTTHDSGNVLLLKDENSEISENLFNFFKKGKYVDYGVRSDEPWYSNIQPIFIVERMLKGANGEAPVDYKFHVFNCGNNSRVILQVDFGRFTNHTRNFYDEKLNLLETTIRYPKNHCESAEIENIDKMFDLAKLLAADFSYVRVDLYNVNGMIYFGEMTFAHESGFGRFSSFEEDLEWGGFWEF